MPEKPQFNQDGVTSRIAEIKAMPDDQRKQEADRLREMGLKAYVNENFTLSEAYTGIIAEFDNSFADEMTYSMALAIEKKNWELVIKFPGGEEPPVAARCKQTTQTVSGSYNQQGGYTVTKTAGWTFN
jgi:hypothetical protein